jgi:AbrB family looped-hinge helix DNA binding protein
MPTAMVTFNGRITLPSQVRKNLGLKTGDSVDFVEMENGRFAICPRIGSTFDQNPDDDCRSQATQFNPAVNEMEKVSL